MNVQGQATPPENRLPVAIEAGEKIPAERC